MPRLFVDLHLHSRYSIGCSPSLDLSVLAEGAQRAGLHIIAAPDFTHPEWLEEMLPQLAEAGDGVYRLRSDRSSSPLRGKRRGRGIHLTQDPLTPTLSRRERGSRPMPSPVRSFDELRTAQAQGDAPPPPGWRAEQARHAPHFLFATEVSCVWTERRQGSPTLRPGASGPAQANPGRAPVEQGRRVHLIVIAPGIGAAEKLNRALGRITGLDSDGRPTLNIPARQFADVAWGADDRFVIIPAHVWTPWYGIYGSKSGFDSIEECFGDLAPRIFAIETGLSSDPAMNWRIADVDGRAIVSFSDAHSAPAMGREATVLDCMPDFPSVVSAIAQGGIVETLEFHPGHGKYHLDGHRKCGVRLWPRESAEARGRCPKCGRKLTLGVLNRIEQLASRPETIASPLDKDGVVRGPEGRPPFRHLVPLRDVLSQALGAGPGSKRVGRACEALVSELGGEIAALTSASAVDIGRVAGDRAADAVLAARRGGVEIDPGYDGEYGTVRLKLE